MKTIDIGPMTPGLPELLELANSGNLILRSANGEEFLLAKVDDLALEVALVREQPELMALLAQRSGAGPRSSLKQVRETLGLAPRAA